MAPMLRLVALAVVGWPVFSTADAADLALKRVMLSSAGVGYFELVAEVDGPTSLALDVPLGQVDDVLKSLVVFDDAGSVGGIELPGRDESRAAFGNVPFRADDLASPLTYLNSLQGVEVTVRGPRPMTGRIMQAQAVHELAPGKDAAAQDRTRVSVLTADGLQQFVLEDSDALQITDPDLRGRIERALSASRQQSGEDRRRITIRSAGTGRRTVRVGYVAASPLWKASYRLLLPPADADPADATARIQGWATLENASGADWADVALTLQWGNPVTFHQAIYRSYFVTRPDVPVEVLGRLLPDVDVRAQKEAAEPAGVVAPAPVPPPPPRGVSVERRREGSLVAAPSDTTTVSESYDTVFALAGPVSLGAGHTASVPILDRILPAARLSLVHQSDPAPVAAIRLRNMTGESLPAGVLTLYDAQAAFVGDARLGGLPAGETRLLPYAQDLRTGFEWRTTPATTIALIKAAAGQLTVDERLRRTMRIRLTGAKTEPRHILLEVPKSPNDVIASGFPASSEETTGAWRFAVDLKPDEQRELTLAFDQPRSLVFSLLDDAPAIAATLNLPGASETARAALAGLGELRAGEASLAAERDRLTAQRDDVERDETRLRANLAAVPTGDALHSRLVQQLGADEARIAQLATAIQAANQCVARAHQAVVDAIAALKL